MKEPSEMPRRIALWGNFGVPWTTETHVALSLESLGHTVIRLQEGTVRAVDFAERVIAEGCSLAIWIQTYGLAVTGGTAEERYGALARLREAGIPTMGFHLDRFWDVKDGRADRIPTEPFFRTDLLATADEGGGRWQEQGINAVWSPPGIYHGEAVRGTPRREYRSPVVFVGSWRGVYHPEWTHRRELVQHLQTRWRHECAFWPRGEAVRGQNLIDLYASVDIVVGDSFMTPGSYAFHSDRIPETLGRGAFLVHPYNPGLETLYEDGKHLRYWPLGDWAELDRLIRYYLDHPEERQAIADAGQRHVQESHTYRERMKRLLPMALALKPAEAAV